MKLSVTMFLFAITCSVPAFAQKLSVQSPNQKIMVSLFSQNSSDIGEWFLKASYNNNGNVSVAIPRIDLGLLRNDQDFFNDLKFLRATKPVTINERYTVLHGKKSNSFNSANELIISFENGRKANLDIVVRVYNDGITFRYQFPGKQGTFIIKDELTSYTIPKETRRWMEKWNPANEGLYTAMADSTVLAQEWCYPALFNTGDKGCWFLLHEADLNRTYCGTKLSNKVQQDKYKLSFPNPGDGRGLGQSQPSVTLPWKSPWRVIIMGGLSDIVESTLVNDVSPPSVVKNAGWIKPGLVSWNYWSSNHGTKDYKIVCEFADLAVAMNWPYTLLDWEWDAMGNGGKLEDALKYIHSKGVKPLIWYNSGGPHTWVNSTPRDRMLTHENRVEEFTKLKKLGIVGVKVDFFESEKQDMISYYLDILEDAALFEIMVYFHGCLVPRGWERTYPHLMTYEAVRGAEWYNNVPDFSMPAPEHNSILPFTRNVVGAMDYTPVTFTNSQYPHVTSYGHELALSILFESGLQHLADRPEGYYELPDAVRTFLKNVPNAWDDTKLLDGYPGRDAILARRKGAAWYIGAVNADMRREKTKQLKFDFLADSTKYQLTLITDGKHDKLFSVQNLVIEKGSAIDVKMLRRGGFAASLIPLQ